MTAAYPPAQPGPSSASLISPHSDDTLPGGDSTPDEDDDDDAARLTRHAARIAGAAAQWGVDAAAAKRAADPERAQAAKKRGPAAGRYSTGVAPAAQGDGPGARIRRTLRHMSLRVVNLAGVGLDHQIRLPDDEDDEGESLASTEDKPRDEQDNRDAVYDLRHALPIRGRTLGFLGPTSTLRLFLYRFLVHPWTEPIILLLIVANAVVLTFQASRPETLPASGTPNPVVGYFHSWEDYALFVLFVIYTLEALARICVSGLLLDPDVPLSLLLTALVFPPPPPTPAPASSTDPALARHASLAHSQPDPGPTRAPSLRARLARTRAHLARPFALADDSATPAPPGVPGFLEKAAGAYGRMRAPSTSASGALRSDPYPAHPPDALALPFRLALGAATRRTARGIPYLRSSWGRIDALAVGGFWVCFVLAGVGAERSAGGVHVGVFRALSVLRIARLLAVTSGTTTIMRSLKTAAPLLTSVAYFVIFAMVLFSIIGIQSFSGSLRRTCFLLPTLGENYTQLAQNAYNVPVSTQFCGAWIEGEGLQRVAWVRADGSSSGEAPKGYTCPLGQVCMETPPPGPANPNSGVESFDTMYNAVLQVIIVASANGWSPLMYSVIDAEFFVSCFYFIVCIVVLNFWLINLFVAVITNTFGAIRADTQRSAFGAATLAPAVDRDEDGWAFPGARTYAKANFLKRLYPSLRWIFVLLALASLALQATRTVDAGPTHAQLLAWGELTITFLFDVELLVRLGAELPAWRGFFAHAHNVLDAVLAVGASVIQVPAVRRSAVYSWLTIFQLARFYRVILEVPRMRPLLLSVFGNMYGLVNMTLFLLLVNLLAALFGAQLMRGDLPGGQGNPVTFAQLFNAFLAVYQVFSSENWTNVLYAVAAAEIPLGQVVVVVVFTSAWLLFANFIVLQMFIAVINENFDVAEEAKKAQQASRYWAAHRPAGPAAAGARWAARLNPYRWRRADPVRVRVEHLPPELVLPMQRALVQDYAAAARSRRAPLEGAGVPVRMESGPGHYSSKSLTMLQRLFVGEARSNDVPLANLRTVRRESTAGTDPADEETERHLELLAAIQSEAAAAAEDVNDALYERRAQKADFITDHPSYDKTLWVFSQQNPLRRLCQRLVEPAGGERIFGTPHSPLALTVLQLVLLLTVIGGIIVESIATPLYRSAFYRAHGPMRFAWFDLAEAAFALVLLAEFVVKLVADGFVFTPNAYVRSVWNVIDGLILAGVLVNVGTAFVFVGGLSRFTRSLKALRALRLVTLIDRMRNTFESLIISGALRIVDAAVLAILYMIPYAVWGLNIFAGLMKECNDSSVAGLAQCQDEFTNNVYGDAFGFLVPRVWDDPSPSTTFSFDSFRASLLILFEIVSLEGWVDVMQAATSLTGLGSQPQTNASQVNAIFFLIYNLMGGVVILTLFVSIIIGNFRSKTGTAFLTQAQREWIDLQKLIKRQRPSKRPLHRPKNPMRAWCYDRAVHKHGWWSRVMTALFVLHIIALMTQTFSGQDHVDSIRNAFFLALTFIFVVDISVRFVGLGWRSFRANGWNLFDVVVGGGSFVTSLVVRFGTAGFLVSQLQKLFLVSIAFKLVQRTNSLNKLFKTVIASLPVILSLLGLWLILFIFFAILFVEVFSMTKWNTAETHNGNYSTIGQALVMLAFMSTGEGWNQYMHDFALEYPRCTNSSPSQPDSDCGSPAWAFTLFIAWNLLSMYIFVNMFTGVVVENFSYVFQTTGGAKSISREEMRSFKKIWAQYANPRTGFLERSQFVPFFSKLNGVFEVRIYPTEYSIPNILAKCRDSQDSTYSRSAKVVDGVDLTKLNKTLDHIDYASIRKRRNVYSRLYHEAVLSHERGKGISFTDILLLLAHHKLIVDREALILKDLVVRTETNKLVTDLVNLDRVRSLLKMLSHRRRFLNMKQQAMFHEKAIPAIIVDGTPSTPPGLTVDITSARRDSLAGFVDSPSPSPRTSLYHSPDISISMDLSAKLQRARRISDTSALSADLGNHRLSRDHSPAGDESAQDILSSIQNSVWGEMMQEAAEEDDKY